MTVEYATHLLKHYYGSETFYSNGQVMFSLPIKAIKWLLEYGDSQPCRNALELMQHIEQEQRRCINGRT